MDSLEAFFQAGIAPAELATVTRLTGAWPYLSVFITLFRGGDEEVLMRLLVLRELGAQTDTPFWSPQELAQRFAYLQPVKLDTILKRLREGELLIWQSDTGLYQLSEGARVALAALSTMIDFAGDDVELGYLTSQVAAGQAVGQVSDEALKHLLARLNELYAEFEEALESQSEFRIRAAQHRLEAVWRWVGKSTEVVRTLTAGDDLSLATLNQAQAIALAQSRMLALAGTFERRLAQLAAQRVHLGASGLTSTDLADYLRHLSADKLAALLADRLAFCLEPAFLSTPEMADVAEFELLARERARERDAALPNAAAAPESTEVEIERLEAAEALYETLAGLRQATPLTAAVLADTYNETAYRLSLLALLGDPEIGKEGDVMADLARLPLRLADDEGQIEPDHPEVASLSNARLLPPGA
ncbi:hypothetical protein [Paludibacterium purpuratum]|uniref:Uncharacterized protein n=1 Tax=Paludibacterium purpuratum TaxID=1144873 RepID=A0A4R7B3K7_9NEIS|nr:hypothetical protein [Paludibacterium purpuratum]TDR76603.1 hypothetical protein DFP86_11028 [Paludibacterium purpuratum]